MDQFVEQLRQVSPLSDEIVGQLLEEMKEVSFAKGELSIREGERDPFVWFVKTGLVRAFVEREGKDISLWFASDSEVINFVYRDISAYNVQMVENTTLLRIPKTKLDYLCRSSLELANWGLKIQDYYLREYENYFRFSTVWHNHLRNKHLTEHLRNNSNELATVRFSAFCGAMLSNNSFLMQR